MWVKMRAVMVLSPGMSFLLGIRKRIKMPENYNKIK